MFLGLAGRGGLGDVEHNVFGCVGQGWLSNALDPVSSRAESWRDTVDTAGTFDTGDTGDTGDTADTADTADTGTFVLSTVDLTSSQVALTRRR